MLEQESSSNQLVAQFLLLGGRNAWARKSRKLLSPTPHDDASESIARSTWTAFQEVENFYRQDRQRFHFIRRCFSSAPVDGLPYEPLPDEFWDHVCGKFSQTLDQRNLGSAIREMLDPQLPPDAKFCIVTDQELTPPPEWRYIIWDDCTQNTLDGGVASLAPIDPAYWRIQDPHRVSRIKHRIRTACLSMVAESCGATRCDDIACFLFKDVESADRLDLMIRMGSDHPGYEHLTGWGFSEMPDNPERIQEPTPPELQEVRA